jgi:hypothetical protein
MRPGKPNKIKLRAKKLPKVGSMSVISGPGSLATFRPPLVEPEQEKVKQPIAD